MRTAVILPGFMSKLRHLLTVGATFREATYLSECQFPSPLNKNNNVTSQDCYKGKMGKCI